MPAVTKDVIITKLYDSDTSADLEAQQFTTFDDMLDRMTPAPRTWDIKAKVKKADVFNAPTARDKARVELTVEATGEEARIDSWVDEYVKIHGSFVPNREKQQKELKEAAEADKKRREELQG
jgi:hypothetical protein